VYWEVNSKVTGIENEGGAHANQEIWVNKVWERQIIVNWIDRIVAQNKCCKQ